MQKTGGEQNFNSWICQQKNYPESFPQPTLNVEKLVSSFLPFHMRFELIEAPTRLSSHAKIKNANLINRIKAQIMISLNSDSLPLYTVLHISHSFNFLLPVSALIVNS